MELLNHWIDWESQILKPYNFRVELKKEKAILKSYLAIKDENKPWRVHLTTLITHSFS